MKVMLDKKKGKKLVFGKFKQADGSVYEGEFMDNIINGKGTYIQGDKRKYVGTWENDKMDRDDIFTWSDNRKYNWENKDDKKDGYGVFEWNDGRIFKGYWKNGKQEDNVEFFNGKNGGKVFGKNGRDYNGLIKKKMKAMIINYFFWKF